MSRNMFEQCHFNSKLYPCEKNIWKWLYCDCTLMLAVRCFITEINFFRDRMALWLLMGALFIVSGKLLHYNVHFFCLAFYVIGQTEIEFSKERVRPLLQSWTSLIVFAISEQNRNTGISVLIFSNTTIPVISVLK